MGCMELSSSSCAQIGVPIHLRRVSQESRELPKGSQTNCIYDVEQGIAMEPMHGNQVSFPVDLGYSELFHITVVTSVSF